MARITTHRGSAKATLDYYLADYYDAGPEFAMQWLGDGAKRLGLEGEVVATHFMRLLENRHPLNDTKLSPRNRENRRKGWDVNFNTPKSVGIAFGLNNDREVIDALRESVNETLLEMEQDVMTRVNLPGAQLHRKTRNLVAAVQIHPDARAVDGQVPDVNIHAHAFISNHTFTGKRWTAADISSIFRDAQGYYEASFQSRLATKLQDIGYQVERTQHNFEITGISRSLIEKFSKRSNQINGLIDDGYAQELAAKKGVSLADAKDMIGALSRKKKGESYSLDELQQHWQAQLTPAESRELDHVKQQKDLPTAPKPVSITAKDAVDFALEHGFEKEAVLRERQVLKDAIFYGIGDNTVDEIRAELEPRDLIRQGTEDSAILTTKALQDEERRILEFAKLGRGSVKPLNASYEIQRGYLSKEQRQAVLGLLNSSDRLQVLRGVAGVGKTTLLEEVLPAIASADRPVALMAPTNKATDNLIADGFKRATTVQAFLLDEKGQKQIENGVIVVDEAGQIGNPTFVRLTEIAKQRNARIIAVGDVNQHQPIERGHPLKLLEQQAGIIPKTVAKIRRQKGKYRDAVAALSRGEIEDGFTQLQDLEYVHELADDADRNSALATAYADASESHKKDKLLVIAPTHAERRKITAAIRNELKTRKLIKGPEHALTTFVSKQLSKAERQDPLNFQPGDVAVFHAKGQGGVQSGDHLTVTQVTKDKVFAEGGKEIPLTSSGAFSVFRPETSSYAVGDVIRLTRGRRQEGDRKKLTNGGLHKIRSFRKGVITLDNGQRLEKDFRFFDHGIAVTSHVSQGTTVHRAFVAASSISFPASSPEQMYVSASRAKKRVDIFTDSTDGLLQAISRFRPKTLASDVQPDAAVEPRMRRHFNRIKSIARKFATNQLKRFYDRLPNEHLKPELGR